MTLFKSTENKHENLFKSLGKQAIEFQKKTKEKHEVINKKAAGIM